MSSELNKWVSPIDQARMPNDVLSRLDQIEAMIQQLKSGNIAANDLSELAQDTGIQAAHSLWLGTGDPNDLTTNPTGIFIASPGIAIGGVTYNLVSLLNGVVQMGITATDGTMQGATGAAVVDSQGIRIFDGVTEIARMGNLLGFLDYIVGNTEGLAIGSTNAYMTYDQTNGLRIKGAFVATGLYPLKWDIWDEVVQGTPDGVTTVFSLTNSYLTSFGIIAEPQIILNGVWLLGSGADYTVASPNTFYMQFAPQTGDILTVNYVKATDLSIIYTETPTGSVNGSNTTFTLANNYVVGSLQVFLNGVTLHLGADFRDSRTLTMTIAPQRGDSLIAAYMLGSTTRLRVGSQYVPVNPIDGSNKVFRVNPDPIYSAEIVVLNGIVQISGRDYTARTPTNHDITFTNAPRVGDSVFITSLVAGA